MEDHSPLNAFSFDISLIEIGQEIKLLEHLKKKWITLYIWGYMYSPFFNYSPMYQLKSRTTVILLSLFNIM
jgi:hypothetical protein